MSGARRQAGSNRGDEVGSIDHPLPILSLLPTADSARRVKVDGGGGGRDEGTGGWGGVRCAVMPVCVIYFGESDSSGVRGGQGGS